MPKSKAKKAKLSPLEQQVLDELAAHDERIFTMEDDYDYEAMAIGRRVAQEQADAAAAARRGPRVRINSGSILEGEDDGVGFGGSDDHHDFHDDFHEFDEDYAAMAIGREMASEPNGLNFLTNLTKAPSPKSSHAKQQEKSLNDFNTHLQELVAAYLGTRNPSILPGTVCTRCELLAVNRCHICLNNNEVESAFCSNHSREHAKQEFHTDIRSNGGILMDLTDLELTMDCCSESEKKGGIMVELYGQGYQKTVRIQTCDHHSPAWTLLRHRFMPSKYSRPVKAFSCKLMESASREMDQHMSNQGALRCQVPGLSPNDEKNLTKHLAAALVQFRQIKNRIRHCHLFESVVAEYGVGRVQCPCIGSPFKQHGCVKIRVGDGNFSAKSLSVASGGGGNYGRTPFSKEYFVEAVECGDPKDSAHSGCGNHFKSGSNATVSKSERLDLGGIFFVNCRHEVTETVMNIKKGEGLKYADTACLLAQLPEELRPVKEIKPEWITQRPEIPAGTQRGVRIFTFRTEEAVDKFINQLPSFLFASVVAMAKGMLENVSVDAVAKRNMLLRMKVQMEQLAAHIRECDLKLKRHQGTNLTASVRRSRNKEYKKLVDLVDVWNEFIQDPVQELTDLEGILESTTLDISELALDGLPDLLDQDEFDTEETEANAASRVDVGQEGVGRKDVASQSTMESLSSRITVHDVFKSIDEHDYVDSSTFQFWRLVEQVYFIHSDLHNIVYFYEDRMERFWASVMHELGEERDAAFRDAARVVIEKRRLWENTRMEEARKLIEFYENLEDFPRSALLQVENGYYEGIHEGIHDLK
ncbi:hypothetical protein HDU79_000579 [Rhizoclosmatium sp. JEL0117]|nr:hypothetical protein HDU79_000579 [Rhizoclosmatium sp. JEL0117]